MLAESLIAGRIMLDASLLRGVCSSGAEQPARRIAIDAKNAIMRSMGILWTMVGVYMVRRFFRGEGDRRGWTQGGVEAEA